MTVEVGGKLWKPLPGATASAAEFVRARSLIMEIHELERWNPWVREDRVGEYEAAVAVFEQWTRAEPGFRQKTHEEFEAEQEQWRAGLDTRIKAATARREQEHAKRAASYDPERARARLALLEQQAVLASAIRQRDGIAARQIFPAMPQDSREQRLAGLGRVISTAWAAAEEFALRVGDAEAVADEHGWLPCERREHVLNVFAARRETEVRELRDRVASQQAGLKVAKDRAERARIREALSNPLPPLRRVLDARSRARYGDRVTGLPWIPPMRPAPAHGRNDVSANSCLGCAPRCIYVGGCLVCTILLCGAERKRVAVPQDGEEREMPGFDVKVPTPARVWNYWVGGKDNFAADREAGEQILEAMPTLRAIAQMSRRFLIDVVHDLAAEHGIRQFLDIGTGLPTADNTHDVAQGAAPGARIVYADYDPVVLTHARALLTSTPEGKTDYIQADVRDPEAILSAARQTLDLTAPVAVILIFVMHFVPDAERPYDVVRRLMEPLPPGSYLVMGHAASDIAADFMAAGADAYNDRVAAQITPRDRAGVSRFFDGLEMIGPGVVPLAQWFGASGDRGLQAYCGVGRKL